MKYVARRFSDNTSPDFWVIDSDNRIKAGARYTATLDGLMVRLHEESRPKTRWTPIAVVFGSERFTPEESAAHAKFICDAMNAQWVANKLTESE